MTIALSVWALLPNDAAAQGEGTVTWDALVDVYFAYDFNEPSTRIRPFATEPARHNEINLNLALVRAQFDAERIRASVAFATGTYVEANYAAEPDLLKNIFEAYAGVRLSQNTWLDAGVLPSHIGFESAITPLNVTYSRSLIAEFSPYFETGVRLTIEAAERFTAAILVLNGWQNIRETDDAKSVGVQLQYRPNARLLLNYGNYLGDQAATGDNQVAPDRQLRFFNDLYGQLALSDRMSVTAAFDFGMQERPDGMDAATWYGGALVVGIAPAPRWKIGVRAELFHDPDQAVVATNTGNGLEAVGASLNLDHEPADGVLLRIEGRLLVAQDPVFPGQDGLEKRDPLITSSIAMTF